MITATPMRQMAAAREVEPIGQLRFLDAAGDCPRDIRQ
jgi:hypothetical protein